MKSLVKIIMMMMACILVMPSCKQERKAEAANAEAQMRHVDPDEFERVIADQDNVILVDMRTPSEYDEGHLEGALLIDVNSGDFRKEAKYKLPLSKTIAVYCRKGKRSDAAGKILVEEGYNVVDLQEGIEAWQKAGKKVVK